MRRMIKISGMSLALLIGQMMIAGAAVCAAEENKVGMQAAAGAAFLETQAGQEKSNYEFIFFSEGTGTEEDMKAAVEQINKWITSSAEKTYDQNNFLQNEAGWMTVSWETSDGDQMLSYTMIPGIKETKWELLLQQSLNVTQKQDVSKLPFGLEYGVTEDDIREALNGYSYRYDQSIEADSMEISCFTVYMPKEDAAEYIQLYTISMDDVQWLESYAESGFSFSTKRLLGKAVYHLRETYDAEYCINELKPELAAAWGKSKDDGEEQTTSWSYIRSTEEVMKDSPLMQSLLWKNMRDIYRTYDSAELCLDENTGHFDVVYDGRKSLILQTVEGWELKPAG